MNELILSPIGIDMLISQFTQVVRAEIKSCINEQTNERLLSTKEACKLFEPEISPGTLYNWCNHGYLTRHCINKRFYYKHSDVINAAKILKRYKRTVGV